MSIVKKGVKAVKKVVKKAAKFVKKNWKPIVIAGLVVFSMGLATVGFAGFSGAMTAAGGGFGGFMSAIGSTMYAGLTALGGTLGLTTGAQGAAAKAGGVVGKGLFSGHLAAALGSESAKAGIAAQLTPGSSAFIAGPPVSAAGGGALMGPPAPVAPGLAGPPAPVGNAPSVPPPVTQTNVPPPPAPKGGLSDLGQAAVISTLGNAAVGYFAGKAAEESEEDPKGYWGVDLTGEGQNVAPPPYSPPPAPDLVYPSYMVQTPRYEALMGADPWDEPQQQGAG